MDIFIKTIENDGCFLQTDYFLTNCMKIKEKGI